jgi:membrane-bound ClpP family serine protease
MTVGSVENRAATSRLASAAEWAGYAGVAPLVLCLAGVGLLPEYAARELAQRTAIAWGAVLLAFAGGLHFGLALAGWLALTAARSGAALLPALCGAAAVLLGGQRGLALLVVGFGGFWLYEHRRLGGELPEAYLSPRRPLTLATCMLLALTMFVSDSAGLS